MCVLCIYLQFVVFCLYFCRTDFITNLELQIITDLELQINIKCVYCVYIYIYPLFVILPIYRHGIKSFCMGDGGNLLSNHGLLISYCQRPVRYIASHFCYIRSQQSSYVLFPLFRHQFSHTIYGPPISNRTYDYQSVHIWCAIMTLPCM